VSEALNFKAVEPPEVPLFFLFTLIYWPRSGQSIKVNIKIKKTLASPKPSRLIKAPSHFQRDSAALLSAFT
jgi:hypothetical protein